MLKNKLLFTLLLLTLACAVVRAQNNSDVQEQQFDEPPRRPQLLRELGLSKEQIREMRTINIENRDRLREANSLLRQARQKLDDAIYAGNFNETVYADALENLHKSQAEVAKIRAATELRIRKLLTAEQLVRFKEIRSKFAQAREDRQEFRQDLKRTLPNRRLKNRQNQRP